MESDLKISRQILFGGFRAEYRLFGEIKKHGISRVGDYVLNSLLPKVCFSGEELSDIKGQDIIAEGQVTKSRLFSLSGQIPDTLDTSSDHTEYRDFSIEITTDFTSFSDNRHINFKPTFHGSHILPPYLRPEQLARVFPLNITEINFGIELYHRHFLINSIALAPVVTQTCLLSCHENSFLLHITAEHLKRKTELPLTGNDLIYKIDTLTRDICDITVSKDWLDKIN